MIDVVEMTLNIMHLLDLNYGCHPCTIPDIWEDVVPPQHQPIPDFITRLDAEGCPNGPPEVAVSAENLR